MVENLGWVRLVITPKVTPQVDLARAQAETQEPELSPRVRVLNRVYFGCKVPIDRDYFKCQSILYTNWVHYMDLRVYP